MGDEPPEWRVVSSHSGADFESGRLHRRSADPDAGETVTDGWHDDDAPPSRIGLDQSRPGTGGKAKVRGAALTMPARMGKVWATVTVKMNDKAYTVNPDVKCDDCGKEFSGGAARVKAHIVGKCTCSTPELQKLRDELRKEAEAASTKAAAKRVEREVDEAAEQLPAKQLPKYSQRPIQNSMAAGADESLDNAIAELIYGDNLSFSLV